MDFDGNRIGLIFWIHSFIATRRVHLDAWGCNGFHYTKKASPASGTAEVGHLSNHHSPYHLVKSVPVMQNDLASLSL